MCDAIRDDSMDVDTNLDTEQVNSVEPAIPCSDHLKNPSMDIGEKESSVPAADVVSERPVEDEAFHDVGLEKQEYVSASNFSGPDIGLLVDMLAEQATRETVGPPFESDSFTVPVIGTDPVLIPGVSSLPRSDGLAVPAIGTDPVSIPGVSSLPRSDGLAGTHTI
ncbi:uncharacterized protein LOC109838909 [Asparagus officinalis]|uniref:uncharacterized protein LOC109838909 n=1 Tax=Asparagus officinalis TaxID=4686 RepID=UPI00098E38E8|nr:uncharacterized protein LOC109838909 [Asparagus officinalis]